ncbi:MAG: asparagine synthase-related protein [Acidobacteriota bacterium]
MSGFAVTRQPHPELDFVARRGPDQRQSIELEGFHVHYFLANVDGRRVMQPFVDGEIVCVFDGEIYSHPSARTDAKVLIDLYRHHGPSFAKQLDGDFALALYDFGLRTAVFATDVFATKPLFVRGTEAASYGSALGHDSGNAIERLAASTILEVSLDDGRRHVHPHEPFDFDHQHKTSYDDWCTAFEDAVRKRAVDPCYMPLSAGYDSGGIHCALEALGFDVKTYAIEGVENVDVLEARTTRGEVLKMTEAIFDQHQRSLRQTTESAHYDAINFLGDHVTHHLLEDRATTGLAWIHSLAKEEGRRVFLSGQGADETVAACRHWPGSRFPDKLEPWTDLLGGWQTAYLTKEEYVAGVLGAEGRYPFLDRAVIQEFLWLSVELKNRYYKAPLHVYMTHRDYPFEVGVKTGFEPYPPARDRANREREEAAKNEQA